MTRGRARRYLLVKQGYYPQVVADAGYTVFDWSTLNAGTLFQDSAKTSPVASNSDPVGAWVDGVQGVDAIQATTANKPTYMTASLNGLPTLSFDGGDLLATANVEIGTFAVWAVFRSSSTFDLIYEQGSNASSSAGMYLYTGNTSSVRVYRATANVKDGSVLGDNTFRIVRHEHNGTLASLLYYANNVNITGGGSGADLGTATTIQPLYIGNRVTGSLGLNGNIAHLTIVSPFPTDTSIIASMESYINQKWGVY